MSNSSSSLVVPDGWKDVLVRTVTVFLVAFVALNLKEYLADAPDVPACTVDAAVVAVGTFLFYATVHMASGPAAAKPEKRGTVSVGR
jgi:hypothetical protein